MSSPGRRIVSQLHVSATTPRFRTTTLTFNSFQPASGPTWQAFMFGMSTTKVIPKTVWRRRSTSQSRRSELTRPDKKAVASAAAFLFGLRLIGLGLPEAFYFVNAEIADA